MASTPQAIIMVGFDYQGGGVDFASIGRHRLARLVAARPGLTVTTLDVGAGTTTVSSVATVKGKPVRSASTAKTHQPVTAANYSVGLGHHTRFDQDQAGRMSILDLYAAVQRVGAAKATAGTVVEVSVFSHGWMGGPILVNSEDGATGRARDPNDKDARLSKDFAAPTATTAQLAAFRAAFAPGACWWNWGCAFTSSYRQVTHRFINSPIYRRTPAGKLKNTEKIKFEFPQNMAQAFYGHDAAFFPKTTRGMLDGMPKFTDLKFERTVGEIKDFYRRGVQNTYHVAVGHAAGVAVRGAFLGTYADYESNDKSIKLPLMEIPRSVKIFKTDFRRYITMWEKDLGFATDPEGHGYGVYPP